MADHGTRGEVDVVADADVGWIGKHGLRQDRAIFPDRVEVAVATEKFGVFLGTGVTESNVEVRKLAVTHSLMAEESLED